MGVLFIDKPQGITSFDICYRLRRVLGTKRIGHTGTLDPNATGVMVVLYDKDTRANQFLLSNKKEYVATVVLGIETDTLDIDGNVTKEVECTMPEASAIKDTLNSFIGTFMQLPPITSAIKVNGKRLFEYQRENKEVEIPLREVTVYEMEMLEVKDKTFTFRTVVSSGTYIRSIVRDCLKKLGLTGTLMDLRRTKIDSIDVSMCTPLNEVLEGKIEVHDLLTVLRQYYFSVELKDEKRAKEGKHLKLYKCPDTVLITHENQVIAIYKKENDELYHCVRGLW